MKTRPQFLPLTILLGLVLAGCGKPAGSTPAASGDSPAGTAPASTAATATRSASAPADLRLRWTPGQRQHQRMAMTMKSETSGGPMPNALKTEVTMNMESSLSVLRPREGGGHELEMEMGDMDMSAMMGEKELMAFDSRGESLGADNPATGLFRAMVGSKLKYLLNSSNRVEQVEGWQDVVKKVSATAPAAGRGMLSGIFNEDYFKQMGDFGRGLPNRTVRPGESWTDQQEISLGPMGRMIMDLTYTFKGWEQHDQQNCAAVTFAGTVTSKPGDGSPSPFGKMTVEGGKNTGTYWFNPDTGRMLDLAMQQDLTMLIDIAGMGRPAPPGGAPPTGNITTRLNQKLQLKFSPDAAK